MLRESERSVARRHFQIQRGRIVLLSAFRFTFAIVAWLFLIAVIVQVFLAGVGFFVPGVDPFSYHRSLGWLLHGVPLLVLLFAWLARSGRTTIWLSVALIVLVGIQPFLPGLRTSLPLVAALHPVNALAIFWVALAIARQATALLRRPTAVQSEPAAEEAAIP